MAKKLEIKNNYLVITDTITSQTIEYPKARVRYKDDSTNIQFKYIDDSTQDSVFQFSELVNENDIAWSSISSLLDWLRINTGSAIKINDSGSIDVVNQSSISPLVIVRATELIAETTLTTKAVIGDKDLIVSSNVGASIGSGLTVYSVLNNRVSFFTILNIVGSVITVDSPIDFDYEISSFVQFGNYNMAVNGSVTPRIFGVRNPTANDIDFEVDLTRMILSMELISSGDYDEFGNIPALTNGLVCRFVDGRRQNIFNVKTNRELDTLMYDFKFIAASGQSPDGLSGRFTFERLGSVIRLKPFEDLQFIVQDNLEGLNVFEILLEGAGVTN